MRSLGIMLVIMGTTLAACKKGTKSNSNSDDGERPTPIVNDSRMTTNPDINLSSITASGPIHADGVDATTVRITLLDSDSNPIPLVTPTIKVTGGSDVSVTQNCTVSDANGVSICERAVSTTSLGTFTVSIETPFQKAGNVVSALEGYDPSARGYQARACGFDMDDDGIFGEYDDDCNVCDGETLDVDGDTQNEDLFYVDVANGTDNATCGAANAPCKSISYVVTSRLDGPTTGQEDIICYRGTSSENLVLGAAQGGKSTTEKLLGGIEYPTNPIMVVGWDFDNDGRYPPFDTDDEAVFAGGSGWWLDLTSGVDNIEIAHLTVNDYTHATTSGVVNGGTSGVSHLFVHDIQSERVNKGGSYSDPKAIYYADQQAEHWTITNTSSLEGGAVFLYAFDSGSQISNNIVIHKNTIQNFGQDSDSIYGTIHLGSINTTKITQNIFDANISASTYDPSDYQTININECTTNILVQDNAFLAVVYGFNVYINNLGTCTVPTKINSITFDRNYISFADSAVIAGYAGFVVQDAKGQAAYEVVDTIVTNNVFDSNNFHAAHAIVIDISLGAGSPSGSTIIAGNTMHGDFTNETLNLQKSWLNGQAAITVTGNIFNLNNAGIHITTTYDVTSFSSTHNTFSGSGTWIWDAGPTATLGAWELASGAASSFACPVTFTNVDDSDFSLSASDVCAKDAGIDLTGLASSLAKDYAGSDRETGLGADIGAYSN